MNSTISQPEGISAEVSKPMQVPVSVPVPLKVAPGVATASPEADAAVDAFVQSEAVRLLLRDWMLSARAALEAVGFELCTTWSDVTPQRRTVAQRAMVQSWHDRLTDARFFIEGELLASKSGTVAGSTRLRLKAARAQEEFSSQGGFAVVTDHLVDRRFLGTTFEEVSSNLSAGLEYACKERAPSRRQVLTQMFAAQVSGAFTP